MADKLSLKWIDGNDVVTVPGTTTSVHISGYTEQPTFNVDDPTMWTPLSVLSGLASGYCERRAIINPEFTVTDGATVNWYEGTATTRDNITRNCMRNLAAGSSGDSVIYKTTTDPVMVPIGTAGLSNYMTAVDAAITTVIGDQGKFVTSDGIPYTFQTLATAAQAKAAEQGSTESAISNPTSNGGSMNAVMTVALPVEWAKERKWMLDQLRYTGSGGADIANIDNNFTISGIELDSSVTPVIRQADGWFPVNSLYSSSYVSGSDINSDITAGLCSFEAYVVNYSTLSAYGSDTVASNVSVTLYSEEDSSTVAPTSSAVTVYFGHIEEKGASYYTKIDYSSLTKVASGAAVTAVKDGMYHVESGGVLTIPPMSGIPDGDASAAITTDSVSRVTVDSGGTLVLATSQGEQYAQLQVSMSGNWAYTSTSIDTATATSSAVVSYYESQVMQVPQTLIAAGGGTMYIQSDCCYIPYEDDPEDPDWCSCYYYNAYNEDWSTTGAYKDDLTYYSLSSSVVVSGSSYTVEFPRNVYMPKAGMLYYMPSSWVLSTTLYTACACRTLNLMNGAMVIPMYNGTQSPSTPFRFQPGFGYVFRDYLYSGDSLVRGLGKGSMCVCINSGTQNINVSTTDNTLYMISNATVTLNGTGTDRTGIKHHQVYAANNANVTMAGPVRADITLVNGGRITAQGGAGVAEILVLSGCSLTLKNGSTYTTFIEDGTTYNVYGVHIGDQGGGSFRPNITLRVGGMLSIGAGESASLFQYPIHVPPTWYITSGCTLTLGGGMGLKYYEDDEHTVKKLYISGYTYGDIELGIGEIRVCYFDSFDMRPVNRNTFITSGWNTVSVPFEAASSWTSGGSTWYDISMQTGVLCSATTAQSALAIDLDSAAVLGSAVVDGATKANVLDPLRGHDYYEQMATMYALAINSGGGGITDHYSEFYVRQFPTQSEIDQATSSATTT